MEYRQTKLEQAQVRIVKRDEIRFIVGYAAVFYRENEPGTEYWLWRDFVERIRPTAFKRAIKEKDDVRALFNHDPNQLLARVGNGLVLKTDEVGLHYEFPVDENDPDHQRVVSKIERGDLSGSSFGFYPQKRTFEEGEDFDIVWLDQVELVDVSPATYPAYSGTEVGTRNSIPSQNSIVSERNDLQELRKAYQDWKSEKITNHELLLKQMKANAGIL